jgi:hypothetical protein
LAILKMEAITIFTKQIEMNPSFSVTKQIIFHAFMHQHTLLHPCTPHCTQLQVCAPTTHNNNLISYTCIDVIMIIEYINYSTITNYYFQNYYYMLLIKIIIKLLYHKNSRLYLARHELVWFPQLPSFNFLI